MHAWADYLDSLRELARWNRSAVPFNLVYLPGKDEPTPLPEILTPRIVLNAFHG